MNSLFDKLEFSPQLPINQEAVQIFTEFIVNLDYSFWNVAVLTYCEYD
jgi:hypothetical protein